MQKTLLNSAKIQGIGLHNGLPVNVVIKPSLPNTGIIFVRTDINDDRKNVIDKSYYYQVQTINQYGISSFGNIVFGSTLP